MTSQHSYKLKITMTDFDELVFDQLKATSPIYWCQKENLGETCLWALSSFWASAGERIIGKYVLACGCRHSVQYMCTVDDTDKGSAATNSGSASFSN